jgi:hypothetical protein
MSALITDEQRFLLLANGRESLQNSDFDPAPVVKLFTPDAGATWLLGKICATHWALAAERARTIDDANQRHGRSYDAILGLPRRTRCLADALMLTRPSIGAAPSTGWTARTA